MKKEFNHKAVMKLLFIIYMCVLVYVVFFAEAMGRTPQDGYVYNLTPLKEIKRFMRYIWDNDALGSAARLNIFGNIIAFMPFGIYLPYTSESKLGFISTFLYGGRIHFVHPSASRLTAAVAFPLARLYPFLLKSITRQM